MLEDLRNFTIKSKKHQEVRSASFPDRLSGEEAEEESNAGKRRQREAEDVHLHAPEQGGAS